MNILSLLFQIILPFCRFQCIYAHGKSELRPMPAWMHQSLSSKGASARLASPAPEAAARPNPEWFDSSVSVDAMTPVYMQQLEHSGGAVSADGTWDDVSCLLI